MRIALLLCVILGISCVTAQQATIQSQLSTNQTLNLHWTCEHPYATATDFQGIVYSSCASNNGSKGILWTYRDPKGQVQTGWVTSPGNGSCLQAWGLSVSGDGEYVFATCHGNPQGMQIIGYQRQLNNGSMWSYNPIPLDTATWACGGDILFDSMTEDIYAICGTTLTSTATRIIRFPHNGTTDSYMMPQDLGIPANYMKMNALNNYLYFATTSNLGWLVIHDDNGTALSMPNNITWIPVNGTLTNYCEITSFTFSHNTTTTLFVGCTGVHNLLTSYTSYSILRIDMNATWNNMTTNDNNSTVNNNNSTMNNSTTNNGSMNSNSSSVMTWSFTAFNITWTDSKAQGADGIQDLTYPADGSCKGPSDMEVDSMNQLYVACMSNPELRSIIRYTQMNATYYLPAYVNYPAQCQHPGTNSLTLTQKDEVIISCYITGVGYEFGFMTGTTNNITGSSSSSSTGGTGFNGTSSSTGGTSNTLPPTIPVFNGSSSSSTGGFVFPNGTSSLSSSGRTSSSSSSVVCVNGTCIVSSSSTGIQTGRATNLHVDVAVFLVSLLLLVVFV